MLTVPLIALLATSTGCGLPPLAAERPFQPGERLRYDVTWNGLRAGETTLTLGEAGAGGLTASLEARQTRLGSSRFAASARVSEATLRPGPFSDAQDGWGPRRTTASRIDGSPNVVRIDWRVGALSGVHAFRRRPEVLDFASAIPYLRAAELTPGGRFCFEVVGAGQYWQLEGAVGGLEQVATGAGRFQALRLTGTLRRADGQGRGVPLRLWIGTDPQRLPVAAEVDSPVGPLRAELAAVTGATHG